jgi:uridine phosphorylase
LSPVHLRVEPGDFAEGVLLPGDSLRATIVPEELILLGAKNLLRAGACGGYDPGLRLGDLIVATAATPQDGTVSSITRGVPNAPAPTSTWSTPPKAPAGGPPWVP